MPGTMILIPLNDLEKSVEMRENLIKIRKLMNYFYKKQEQLSFQEVLDKLKLNESQYINALRSSLKRVQVFLKRSSLEVGINSYNKNILHLFESNIEVQFVLEECDVASYIINYVGKVDACLSKLLRDAASDANKESKNIKDKF
ncbi:unnamed protein product [Psylliodes chrysocephalus]|uniref:Uncharacterized protein n=1 Tax=Psylliodes chrysocephalus TaxID=3402493 RepID=A0A9P0CRG3_9CUCU|nr:unnamed protein product [Psylliodes chrysocephala]